jgi:hypothetical protein
MVAFALLVLSSSGTAVAQLEITPETSITPSSHVTSWVFQMAVASVILAVLVLIGFTFAYLRFAPTFSGREGKTAPLPPGSRPAALTRQAAAMRWTPPAAPSGTHAAAASASQGTATAVAERPAPAPEASAPQAPAPEAPAPEAPAPEATAPEAPAPEATAPEAPAPEAPAPEAPEGPAPEAPEATTPEAPEGPAPEAPEATTPEAPAAAAPAPAQPAPAPQTSHGAGLDQQTFDRVLQEQLAKGVDRRVAEGRARAAAVVAARKKSQG